MIRHHELPRCPRCGRLLETCTFYDEAGCVGVPKPEHMQAPFTDVQQQYWSALGDHMTKSRAPPGQVRTPAHDWRERPERGRRKA